MMLVMVLTEMRSTIEYYGLLYVMRYRHKFGWSDYFGERE